MCTWKGIEVEEVRLDLSASEHEVVVLLRDFRRPECLFGWRAHSVEPGGLENGWVLEPEGRRRNLRHDPVGQPGRGPAPHELSEEEVLLARHRHLVVGANFIKVTGRHEVRL